MSESEPSAVNAEGDETEARVALEFPHGIEAIIDVAWNASKERRNVTIVGSSATLRFDLDIHDRAVLVRDGRKRGGLRFSNISSRSRIIAHGLKY